MRRVLAHLRRRRAQRLVGPPERAARGLGVEVGPPRVVERGARGHGRLERAPDVAQGHGLAPDGLEVARGRRRGVAGVAERRERDGEVAAVPQGPVDLLEDAAEALQRLAGRRRGRLLAAAGEVQALGLRLRPERREALRDVRGFRDLRVRLGPERELLAVEAALLALEDLRRRVDGAGDERRLEPARHRAVAVVEVDLGVVLEGPRERVEVHALRLQRRLDGTDGRAGRAPGRHLFHQILVERQRLQRVAARAPALVERVEALARGRRGVEDGLGGVPGALARLAPQLAEPALEAGPHGRVRRARVEDDGARRVAVGGKVGPEVVVAAPPHLRRDGEGRRLGLAPALLLEGEVRVRVVPRGDRVLEEAAPRVQQRAGVAGRRRRVGVVDGLGDLAHRGGPEQVVAPPARKAVARVVRAAARGLERGRVGAVERLQGPVARVLVEQGVAVGLGVVKGLLAVAALLLPRGQRAGRGEARGVVARARQGVEAARAEPREPREGADDVAELAVEARARGVDAGLEAEPAVARGDLVERPAAAHVDVGLAPVLGRVDDDGAAVERQGPALEPVDAARAERAERAPVHRARPVLEVVEAFQTQAVDDGLELLLRAVERVDVAEAVGRFQGRDRGVAAFSRVAEHVELLLERAHVLGEGVDPGAHVRRRAAPGELGEPRRVRGAPREDARDAVPDRAEPGPEQAVVRRVHEAPRDAVAAHGGPQRRRRRVAVPGLVGEERDRLGHLEAEPPEVLDLLEELDAVLVEVHHQGPGVADDVDVEQELTPELGLGARGRGRRALPRAEPLLEERRRVEVAQQLVGDRAQRAAPRVALHGFVAA